MCWALLLQEANAIKNIACILLRKTRRIIMKEYIAKAVDGKNLTQEEAKKQWRSC